MSFEEQVRERAYHIWLAGGMADGKSVEHWICAEQALRGETAGAEPVVIMTKAAAKPRKTTAAKPAVKAEAKVAKAKATKARATKARATKAIAKPATRAKAAKTAVVQPTAH